MGEFRFELGQIVYHRINRPAEYKEDTKPARNPLLIVERIKRECEGGIQLSYACRLGCPTWTAPTIIVPEKFYEFFEIELEA
jgi:hypothetical protein